jgi:type II secretory pathway pseudopilin PulG
MKKSRAFTFVEILVVVAVLIVLYAISMAVIQEGKRRALDATDASNLRQLGMASSLYGSDNDTIESHRLITLATSGLAPIAIMRSAGDPTAKGIANSIISCDQTFGNHKTFSTPEYDSYLSVADSDVTSREEFNRGTNVGWLVALTRSIPAGTPAPIDDCRYFLLDGDYQRLLNDGSVQHRAHRRGASPQSPMSQSRTWFFADEVQ